MNLSDPLLVEALAREPRDLAAAIRSMIEAAASRALLGVAGAEDMAAALKAFRSGLEARRLEATLLGAEATVKAAERVAAREGLDLPTIMADGALPEVAPTRAVAAILRRTPRLVRTARQVSALYRPGVGGFGAVHAAEITVLQRVQGAIAEALKSGATVPTVRDVVRELGDWTRGYAETVARTNMMTAYADGEFAQVNDPDIADLIVGFEIVGPTDGDARPNHAKAVGWRAEASDPRWSFMRTPLGYKCRHSVRAIDRFQAERSGWLDGAGRLRRQDIPSGAGPDRGFRA